MDTGSENTLILRYPVGVAGRSTFARALLLTTLVSSVASCLLAPFIAFGFAEYGSLAYGAAGLCLVTGLVGLPFGFFALVTGESVIDVSAGSIVRHTRLVGIDLKIRNIGAVHDVKGVEVQHQGNIRYPRYNILLSGRFEEPIPIASFGCEDDALAQVDIIKRTLQL